MAFKVLYEGVSTRREIRKQVPVEITLEQGTATGTSSVADGYEEVLFNVQLDMEEVHCMARRAAKSKGQKSTDGPVRVIVTSRKRVG